MQLTAVCLTLLVSFLGAAYSYDCDSSLMADLRQCLVNVTLNFTVSTPDVSELLRSAQFIHVETHCRKTDSYMKALECSMESIKKCVIADVVALFPDPTKMRQGINFMCQHLHDINTKCLQNRFVNIEQCGKDLMKGVMEKYRKENRQSSVTEIGCTSFDIAYDCGAFYLKDCLSSTKAIYLEQLDKYMVPTVCPSPSRSRTPYILSSTASLTALIQPFSAVLVSMATLIFLCWSG